MNKSAIYAANVNTQTLSIGGIINFGVPVRRFGCNCSISGGDTEVTGCGYYGVDTNITYTAGGAGDVTIQLYKDGVVIPGASVTKTVASGSIYSFNIPAIMKQSCNCTDTITAVLTGVAGTVNNAAIKVVKL